MPGFPWCLHCPQHAIGAGEMCEWVSRHHSEAWLPGSSRSCSHFSSSLEELHQSKVFSSITGSKSYLVPLNLSVWIWFCVQWGDKVLWLARTQPNLKTLIKPVAPSPALVPARFAYNDTLNRKHLVKKKNPQVKCVPVAVVFWGFFCLCLTGWLLSHRPVPPWLPAPSFWPCWSTADCPLLGADWRQQPSPAMQVHPHSATVQGWTGHRTNRSGEQQVWKTHACKSGKIYFFSLWLSEVQFKWTPTLYFLLRTPYPIIHITYRDCILIPFHIAHQKREQPHCRILSTEMWIFSEDFTHIPCLAKPQLKSSSDAYEGHPHEYFLTLCFLACARGIFWLRSWQWGTVQGLQSWLALAALSVWL